MPKSISSYSELNNEITKVNTIYDLQHKEENGIHKFLDKNGTELFRIENNYNSINTKFQKEYLLNLSDLNLNNLTNAVIGNQLAKLKEKTKRLIRKYDNLDNYFGNDLDRQGRLEAKRRHKELKKVLNFIEKHWEAANQDQLKDVHRMDQNDLEQRRWSVAINKIQWTPATIVHNRRRARIHGRKLKKGSTRLQQFNRALREIDMMQIDQAEKQHLKKRLSDVQTGTIDPAITPYTFQHYEDFNSVRCVYPALDKFIDFEQNTNRKATRNNRNNNWGRSYNNNTNNNNRHWHNTTNRTVQTSPIYADTADAMRRWWPNWVMNHMLDKTNMSPKMKQTRRSIGSVASTAAMVYVWFKFIKSARNLLRWGKDMDKKEKKKARARVLWVPALAFGMNAMWRWVTDVNWFVKDIFNKISGKKTNNTEINNNTTPEAITYAHGFPKIGKFFHGMNYKQMSQFIENDNGKMKIKYDELLAYHTQIGSGSDVIDDINELKKNNDPHNQIHKALTEACGITYADLKNSASGTKKFNDAYSGSALRLKALDKFMEDNDIAEIKQDATSQRKFKTYLKGSTSPRKDLEQLKKDGVFVIAESHETTWVLSENDKQDATADLLGWLTIAEIKTVTNNSTMMVDLTKLKNSFGTKVVNWETISQKVDNLNTKYKKYKTASTKILHDGLSSMSVDSSTFSNASVQTKTLNQYYQDIETSKVEQIKREDDLKLTINNNHYKTPKSTNTTYQNYLKWTATLTQVEATLTYDDSRTGLIPSSIQWKDAGSFRAKIKWANYPKANLNKSENSALIAISNAIHQSDASTKLKFSYDATYWTLNLKAYGKTIPNINLKDRTIKGIESWGIPLRFSSIEEMILVATQTAKFQKLRTAWTPKLKSTTNTNPRSTTVLGKDLQFSARWYINMFDSNYRSNFGGNADAKKNLKTLRTKEDNMKMYAAYLNKNFQRT